jgi:UDP-N-acetylglucosamine--N-acetylmuramyl-(pentapeptide) pyrophosphoryl-undecaprenol N-acetylglucosamine transferase
MRSDTPRLIVAGGGTGGHVAAGIAIADEWKKRHGTGSVIFVGARGGIEERLVPRAGYPLRLLKLGSLKRVGLSTRLRTLALLPWSLIRSKLWLLELRPKAVVGVGGYASGPLVLMARLTGFLWGARVGILEQNAVPGLTNRILGHFAHRIFAAFPGLEGHFNSSKLSVTGNPVRESIRFLNAPSLKPFGIFIFGGSQGAQAINTLVIEALPHLKDLIQDLRFVHQTGEKDHERVASAYAGYGIQARVEKFIYDMPECYQAASLLICRSGSSTLSEVAAVGRPAILIPFPFAADNHQEHNARIFEKAGAALVMLQQDSSGNKLAETIRGFMVGGSGQITRMSEQARTLHHEHCASLIVDRLLD